MEQDKCLFLTATVASILSLYNIESRADTVTCPSGKMLPAGYERCIECSDKNISLYIPNNSNPASFYCPGGTFKKSSSD